MIVLLLPPPNCDTYYELSKIMTLKFYHKLGEDTITISTRIRKTYLLIKMDGYISQSVNRKRTDLLPTFKSLHAFSMGKVMPK